MIRFLIRLFPRHFRSQYGDDMRDVYRDQIAAALHSRVPLAATQARLRIARRMIAAAAGEHLATRRARRGSPMLDFFRYDLRLTARGLTRTPVFSAITIGVVAIGIGAVGTIFSALNALVLRPIPGTTDGHELFTIDRRSPDLSEGSSMSAALYRHLQESSRSMDGLAVWSRVQLSMTTGAQNIAVNGSIVSDNYFETLGLRPAAGRFFVNDETRAAVVISHAIWRRHFGGATDVAGRVVTLNGRPYTVIGVAPEGFRGVFTPLRLDAWVPLSAQPHVRPGRDLAHAPWLWMFGRVQDGVSRDQARAELSTLVGAWTTSTAADRNTRYTVMRFTPLTGLPDDARTALLGFGGLMLGAALLVLAVAGANVSTLLAIRATGRQQEMGLRTALGAGRWRLIRQLLAETLVLFLAGAVGGLLLTSAGTWALEQLQLPGDVGLMLELSPDLRVVAVLTVVGLMAGVVFGIGPALRGTQHQPALLIRSATAGSGTRRRPFTSALIVIQLAASLVLLSTTSLFVRALHRGAAHDPGFVGTHVSFMSFNTEAFGYDEERSIAFYSKLRDRVAQLGQVEALAFGQAGPMLAQTSGGEVMIPRDTGEERIVVEQAQVGEEYFSTLGITIQQGRALEARDLSAPVAVVSESFARRAWPERAQVTGLTFRRGQQTTTVVGVARDVTFGDIGEPNTPFVYVPLAPTQQNAILFMRTEPGTRRLDADLAAIVRELDPAIPVPPLLRMTEEAAVALLPQRVAAMITGVLGAGALLLACAGLYGAIAFLVAARTREVGVRMALGATPREIAKVFMRDGLRLTAIAVVIGLAGSAGAAQLTSGLLLGGSTVDTAVFALAALVLVLVAGVATAIPARRAATVDPVTSLRT